MAKALSEIKEGVKQEIDEASDDLKKLSKQIFENPELKFEEYKAMNWLTEALEDAGFEVQRGAGGMETAFIARCPHGSSGPTLAFLSEYDALPGLGHACGHNLIAGIGVGAGLGLCSVMEELGGQLMVIGTPAEEGGGGKIELIEAGVFEEVDVAMMAHPSDQTLVGRGSLGIQELKFDFYGEAAHASSRPEEGVNALDAAIATFNNVNGLREHIKDSSRVHGIITDGGEKPNIVPEHAGAKFYVRAKKLTDLNELLEKVRNCAEAGALATGAELEVSKKKTRHNPMKLNSHLIETCQENLENLGVEVEEHEGGMGSTDMGDVSHVVPAIHPYIKIAEKGTPAHSVAFAEAANSEEGYSAMITAAKGLAMTGVDVLGNEEKFEAIRNEFNED
ncbi:MAG: M20 family metallopeptidase [Candidatus Acetothermia bacterium]